MRVGFLIGNVRQVGTKTSALDRILGAHFFSPAHIMPLLEIVRTEKTSKQVRQEYLARSV
jgi:enoyl-CoA hydratase/3-hydroxyacyl-CoA dehydrogenase